MIATGTVSGLLLTTKLSVLPLAPILLVLALMAPTWRRRLSLAMIGCLSALAVSGWYLIQNFVRYGDPTAHHASVVYLTRLGALGNVLWGVVIPFAVYDPIRLVFLSVPSNIVETFWYQSDWSHLQWPAPVGAVLTCVVGAVLLGLIGRHVARQVLVTLGAIAVLSLLSVWLVAFQTKTFAARLAAKAPGALEIARSRGPRDDGALGQGWGTWNCPRAIPSKARQSRANRVDRP